MRMPMWFKVIRIRARKQGLGSLSPVSPLFGVGAVSLSQWCMKCLLTFSSIMNYPKGHNSIFFLRPWREWADQSSTQLHGYYETFKILQSTYGGCLCIRGQHHYKLELSRAHTPRVACRAVTVHIYTRTQCHIFHGKPLSIYLCYTRTHGQKAHGADQSGCGW